MPRVLPVLLSCSFSFGLLPIRQFLCGIIDIYSAGSPAGSSDAEATDHGSRSKARESPVSFGPIRTLPTLAKTLSGAHSAASGDRGKRQRPAAVLFGQFCWQVGRFTLWLARR